MRSNHERSTLPPLARNASRTNTPAGRRLPNQLPYNIIAFQSGQSWRNYSFPVKIKTPELLRTCWRAALFRITPHSAAAENYPGRGLDFLRPPTATWLTRIISLTPTASSQRSLISWTQSPHCVGCCITRPLGLVMPWNGV